MVRNEKYNELPDRTVYNRAMKNPIFRQQIIQLSVQEDADNFYYSGMLDTLCQDCLGPLPYVASNESLDSLNDAVEDRWRQWGSTNQIGEALRQIRRGAARTGLGIGIPYVSNTSSDPVRLSIRTLSGAHLRNPRGVRPGDRIEGGIQYDENWEIEKVFVLDDEAVDGIKEYSREEALLWYKPRNEIELAGTPECGPAFTIFPSVRRFMESVVKGEEFKAAIPMAVKLDPDYYAIKDKNAVPHGAFEYEPGMVPTLPPGADLTGLNISSHSEERSVFLRAMIGGAARCIQMPVNIAFGDSSNHNMASAQIDIQPWQNKIQIDRFDFEPVLRKLFGWWYSFAILRTEYLPPVARQIKATEFKYGFNYDDLFRHPDPNKVATARATDLISGARTLHSIYSEQGLNARRELNREAQLLGIDRQQLNEIIMISRSANAKLILQEGFENAREEQGEPKPSN